MKVKQKKRINNENIGYLLIAPSYLIYLLFVLVPVLWTIVMSFTNYNLREWHFTGISNYIQMFQDKVFLRSIWNTVRYSLMTIPVVMVLALCLAMLLNQRLKAKGFFRTLFYLPNIFSMVAVSMAWLYLYDTNSGILNRMLNGLGLESVGWVSNTAMSMISVAIMSIWNQVGYNMILFLSGLQGIPEHLYEAASIDGATRWQKFRHITLPQLAPTTFFVFVMACIHSFQVFGQVLIVTNGGPVNSTTTIAHQIYKNGFEYFHMGYASAQAVVLLLIILAITIVNWKYGKGGTNDGE
ncbi:MAG: sugar ABC transporter permease [Lachnospiraceae bacterium]|nr:sugar ABC transporter permease [Lachnospiraceae bacterium]